MLPEFDQYEGARRSGYVGRQREINHMSRRGSCAECEQKLTKKAKGRPGTDTLLFETNADEIIAVLLRDALSVQRDIATLILSVCL